MKRALITTTIHTGHRLHAWAQQLSGDDIIVIAGDQRSPHEDLRALVDSLESEFGVHSVYLDPGTQARRYPRTSNAVPWNCIQRRNLALLEALHHSPDYVITVDDDNVPADDRWVERVDAIMAGTDVSDVDVIDAGALEWWDPGRLGTPWYPFRGFPLEHHVDPHDDAWFVSADGTERPVGVFQSMILGDPDVDAVTRLTMPDPTVFNVNYNAVCERGTWAPFNSQATVWSKTVAPLLFMWPFVGRYDDIWASYLARAVMDPIGLYARYGHPVVRQERNAHNVHADLRAELLGMEHNLGVANALREESAHVTSGTTTLEALIALFTRVTKLDFMPPQLGHSFNAWLEDVADLEWIK